jgi:glycosyltransferase A (GT-A) superfamily protein (DUF2064 family)
METQFGSARPWQADEANETLAVQVITLVQPPGSLDQALFRETVGAVLAAPVARRVLVFGAASGDWLPAGFELMGQRGSDFGERVAAALADAHATAPLPMLLIRTDTLEVTADMLADAARSLTSGEADAVFGPTYDGGFWLIGLRRPDRSLVVGIPEPGQDSAVGAGRLLLDRLAAAGLRIALAPRLEMAGAGARVLRL